MYTKQLFYRGLDQIPIYIEDTSSTSPYYFNIVDMPATFGPGKNSIRFNLNRNCINIYKDIDVEIIDGFGNTIYYELPEYSQTDESGISIITVYIYNNIPNGPLKVTFIGHATIDLNGNPIPAELADTYTVRYSTIVNFNRFQKNTSRILFSETPKLSILESRTAYVSRSINPSQEITVSGSGIYRYNQSYPVLEIPQGTSFINDMLNARIQLTGSNIVPDFSGYATSSFVNYSTTIVNMLDSQTAVLGFPWTASLTNVNSKTVPGLVTSADVIYTASYSPTPNYSSTENFKSFVNLQIKNMDPVSGYLKRIKLYGKSRGSLDQYELIGDSPIENPELLINSASLIQNDRSNVGYFLDSSSFQNFWTYNNTFLSASFTSASLFNSIYLNPLVDTSLNNVMFSSNVDVNFQKGSPYRLFFNYKQNQSPFILEIYLSGSAFKNTSQNLGERIFYLDSAIYGPVFRNIPIDFLATSTGTAKLQFKILTGSLYISDISLKSGTDLGFTPSNFNSYFPINVKSRNDVFDFRVDLIDDNGQISSYEYSQPGSQISGSNFYLEGFDNLMPGSINLGSTVNSGIVFDGSSNKISTVGYTGGAGFAIWSGSQSISGSIQSGSGFYLETGAPNYHYIKGAVGGTIEINGDLVGATAGVSQTVFNNYTSSTNESISSINNFTASVQTPEFYQTLFGIPCNIDGSNNENYFLQIKCLNGTASFKWATGSLG